MRYLPSFPRTLFFACADRDAYLATPRPEASLTVNLPTAFAASFALAFRRRRMALYCFAFTYTAASVVGNKTLECARARAFAVAAAGVANNSPPNGFPLVTRSYALGSTTPPTPTTLASAPSSSSHILLRVAGCA